MNETQSGMPETALGVLGRQLAQPVMPTQNVVVTQVENGFIIIVGCKQFVSQHVDEMLDGLRLYFTKPEEAAKKFLKERK